MGIRNRERWSALFVNRRPAACELLLLLVLANTLLYGYFAFTRPLDVFMENDAFSPATLGIEPAGWVAWFPPSWVLSYDLYRAVGLVAFLSALLWIFKRLLPWAPIVCALSFGLHVSHQESLEFNYHHELLPGVVLLTLFAGLYTLRHASFSEAIRKRRFWTENLYPQWVFVLVVVYLGLSYPSAGMIKIFLGGADSVNGLTLQLLLLRFSLTNDVETLSLFAQPLVRYRVAATAAMFMTILLEAGAMPAFVVPGLRRWWACGLMAMQTSIWLAMGILFHPNIALLTWIALPFEKWLATLGEWLRDRGWTISLREESYGWRTVSDLVCAVDVLGILKPEAVRRSILK